MTRREVKKEMGGLWMIPKDAGILLGFINTKLRDFYSDLEQLCEDLDVSQKEITEKLAGIGCHYDRERNQFIC